VAVALLKKENLTAVDQIRNHAMHDWMITALASDTAAVGTMDDIVDLLVQHIQREMTECPLVHAQGVNMIDFIDIINPVTCKKLVKQITGLDNIDEDRFNLDHTQWLIFNKWFVDMLKQDLPSDPRLQ
jgi:hypothetical protein